METYLKGPPAVCCPRFVDKANPFLPIPLVELFRIPSKLFDESPACEKLLDPTSERSDPHVVGEVVSSVVNVERMLNKLV